MEQFRPLLPVGYQEVVNAYQTAAGSLNASDLTDHYTTGVSSFEEELVPYLKRTLRELSGNEWNLSEYEAFAAGSDVDLMAHVINSVSSSATVALYPGDWYGFLVGSPDQERIVWNDDGQAAMACLCVPSVRNGHLTSEMVDFLDSAGCCLLNLNLYPTLSADERKATARGLKGVIGRSILSISFSRGFGLTASQLGVILVPRGLAVVQKMRQSLEWFSYFYNLLAARAFMQIDLAELQRIDTARREWVASWLDQRRLPSLTTGTYYVRSFAVVGELPNYLAPLERDGIVRLCFKPPQVA